MLQLLGLGLDPTIRTAAPTMPLFALQAVPQAAPTMALVQAAPMTAPNVNALLIKQLQCLLNMAMLSGDASTRFQRWEGKVPTNWALASAWVPLAVDGYIKPAGAAGINEAASITLLSQAGIIQFNYLPPGFGPAYVAANTAAYVGGLLSYLSQIGYSDASLAACDFPGQAAVAAAVAAQSATDATQAAIQAQNAATAAAAQQATLDAQNAANAAAQGTAPSPGMTATPAPAPNAQGMFQCPDGSMTTDLSLCPVPAVPTSLLQSTISIAGYAVPVWAIGAAAIGTAYLLFRR